MYDVTCTCKSKKKILSYHFTDALSKGRLCYLLLLFFFFFTIGRHTVKNNGSERANVSLSSTKHCTLSFALLQIYHN